jgi:bifunctional non-homologous end joining protein LigD
MFRRRHFAQVLAMAKQSDAVVIEGVRLTSPDKVLFPEQGVTKRDLATYLVDAAEWILPHLVRRPLSLVRCPQGQAGNCFFQKHGMAGFPEPFRTVKIREKDGDLADYLYVDDGAGLAASAQMGVLELHVWGSHVESIDSPDRLVFDLDPDEGMPFAELRRAAQELRKILSAAGLESFPMLTGGKGLHIVLPLDASQDWGVVRNFAAALARRLAETEPDRFTSKAAKAGRKGKIFIDWLRNDRGSTAIAPYSTRARRGATIATPLTWQELSRTDRAAKFDLGNIRRRLKSLKKDPWDGYFRITQSLSSAALKAVEDGKRV